MSSDPGNAIFSKIAEAERAVAQGKFAAARTVQCELAESTSLGALFAAQIVEEVISAASQQTERRAA